MDSQNEDYPSHPELNRKDLEDEIKHLKKRIKIYEVQHSRFRERQETLNDELAILKSQKSEISIDWDEAIAKIISTPFKWDAPSEPFKLFKEEIIRQLESQKYKYIEL